MIAVVFISLILTGGLCNFVFADYTSDVYFSYVRLNLYSGEIYTDPNIIILRGGETVSNVLSPSPEIYPGFNDPAAYPFYAYFDRDGEGNIFLIIPPGKDGIRPIARVLVNDILHEVSKPILIAGGDSVTFITTSQDTIETLIIQPDEFRVSVTSNGALDSQGNPAKPPWTVVPEPTTLALWLIGIGLGLFRFIVSKRKSFCNSSEEMEKLR